MQSMAEAVERCPWAGNDSLYVRYHDEEWGVPKHTDQEFFEKLILEGFQAGLSWITILRKREAFREAFHGFDAEKMAAFGPTDIEKLLANPGIIRHRGKIEAAVTSAKAYIAMQERESLAGFFWSAVDGKPMQNAWSSSSQVPPNTAISDALSKGLKARGFRFCGPTTVYALMQSHGLVNDHLVSCFRHAECAALARR
jgi:DNA-3-methyladenine glycosylase I